VVTLRAAKCFRGATGFFSPCAVLAHRAFELPAFFVGQADGNRSLFVGAKELGRVVVGVAKDLMREG